MTGGPRLRPGAKSSLVETRDQNRKLVLQHLFSERAASRADLARLSGLSKATVSEICEVLVQEALVLEAGVGVSTGGKPPTLLEVNASGRFIIAVDLSQDYSTAALFGLDGRITRQSRGKAFRPSPEEATAELHRLLGNLLSQVEAPPLGIGIAVPGEVILEQPLQEMVEGMYDIPTVVTRPVDAAAIAEYSLHPEWGEDPLIFVAIGLRTPVALVLDGRLQPGNGTLHSNSDDLPKLVSELITLLSVMPDAHLVLGGNVTDQVVAEVADAVQLKFGGSQQVSKSQLRAAAVLRGCAAAVMVDQIGVVRR